MALSMLRQGLQAGRVLVSSIRLVPAAVSVDGRRTIVSRTFKVENHDKPKPWPYETMKFGVWDTLFEDTQDRFDENSRIIVIEGNIGVGKSYLAKRLADELDFLLFPEATMDFKYIDDDGFDLRSLNHMLPDSIAPYDIEKFYKHPNHQMAVEFQYSMLALRYEQWLDAMAHLLNTGQGIILERSFYTDFVFAKAMRKAGYIDEYGMKMYELMRRNCGFYEYLPHVVIYLDAPIDVLQQRIKNRGLPYEQNTSVLTPEYLAEIDRCYKEEYLPSIADKLELVTYDWSTFGDPQHVAEDLERLPLEKDMYNRFEKKHDCWKGHNARSWDGLRIEYTNDKHYKLIENIYSVARHNYPHLITDPHDIEEYNAVYKKYVPPYLQGWNTKDDSYIWRIDSNYRLNQRYEFYRTR